MPDAPEIPEAKDPFEKRVALTIAIIAIILSFVQNEGDNSQADAIIRTNEASNQWAYYQAKSIKGQIAELNASLLPRLPPSSGESSSPEAIRAEAERLKKEAARYDKEKDEIQAKAKALQAEASHLAQVNDRCDHSALFLQVAVVVASVAILAGSRVCWWIGIILGVIGTIVGGTAFLM